jgi:hypothetical protein
MRRALFVTAVVAAALAIVPAGASAARIKFFQAPSGNIACVVGAGLARCDIQQHSWPTPPKPASCMEDYGNGVEVIGGHPGEYTCAGDSVFSPGIRVLQYGDKITKNRFTCTSKVTGMRCSNRNSGHGFFISRESVNLF